MASKPALAVAHAALAEAGRPDLREFVIVDVDYGLRIKIPCPEPHLILRAVGLAHQAAGHLVVADYEPGHAHFECFDCGLQ